MSEKEIPIQIDLQSVSDNAMEMDGMLTVLCDYYVNGFGMNMMPDFLK